MRILKKIITLTLSLAIIMSTALPVYASKGESILPKTLISYQNLDYSSASLNKSKTILYLGKQTKLKMSVKPQNAYVDYYVWSSSNSSVAGVSNTSSKIATVTGYKTGKAVITCRAYNEDGDWVSASCTIQVTLKPSDQKLVNNIKKNKIKFSKVTTLKYSANIVVKKDKKLKGVDYQLGFRPRGRNSWDTVGYTSEKIHLKYLFSNTKYQLRIRAYKYVGDKYYYGPWSTIRTIKTKK